MTTKTDWKLIAKALRRRWKRRCMYNVSGGKRLIGWIERLILRARAAEQRARCAVTIFVVWIVLQAAVLALVWAVRMVWR